MSTCNQLDLGSLRYQMGYAQKSPWAHFGEYPVDILLFSSPTGCYSWVIHLSVSLY